MAAAFGGGAGAWCGISERTSGNDATWGGPGGAAAAATLTGADEISDEKDHGGKVGGGNDTSTLGSGSGGRTATPCALVDAERRGTLQEAMRKSGIALTRSSDQQYNRRKLRRSTRSVRP
jgi:hypothetical protein